MGRLGKLTSGLCLLLLASAAHAQAQDDDAKKFGARERLRLARLSPDGSRVVGLTPGKGRETRVVVIAVDGKSPSKIVLASNGQSERLSLCDWANDDRIICYLRITDGTGNRVVGFTRLLTLKADGSDLKALSVSDSGQGSQLRQDGGAIIDWRGDAAGESLLMTRQWVPQTNVGQGGLSDTHEGLGVERVNPSTLTRATVEPPRADAADYIADGDGVVRVMGTASLSARGYTRVGEQYWYRTKDDRKWLALSKTTSDGVHDTGFEPVAVDEKSNVAYGYDHQNGHLAVVKVALDGSLKQEAVFAKPDVDAGGLIEIGRQHRIVGVSYETDKANAEFFDPELKALQEKLSKALSADTAVSFVGASADESRLLLWIGSDTDPGTYAIFDKKTHQLSGVQDVRPELAGYKLAPMKAVSFKAADGTDIPGYLTLPVGGDGKHLPTIILPHGGPADRDSWGFDWLPQYFAARGFAVLQPEFRGSAGYGDAWFQKNGFQSWKIAVGDVTDGARWLVKEGVADPAKLAIVGWSYGGYAALQSQVLDPDLFKAVVAIAPVTDLNAFRAEHENFTDYSAVDFFIGRGPHVHDGSPAQNVARFKAPVLMFHGDLDQNVYVDESRLMQARLRAAGKQVDLVEFKGLDHQLDDSDARSQMLGRIDTFLRASLGMK